MSLFLVPGPSQTKILGKFIEIYFVLFSVLFCLLACRFAVRISLSSVALMVLIYWSRSSLRASSCLGRSGGGAGKGMRACNYFSGIFNSNFNSQVAPRRLSCQISASHCEAETNANVKINRNDVITNVISANQHFASTFSMQIFRFQRRTCSCKFS